MSKPLYEELVAAFDRADADYKALQESFESGKIMLDIIEQSSGQSALALQLWNSQWEKLKELLEERNSILRTVKDSLRQSVQLGPTQVRGPDGHATVIKAGNFTVSSVTRRNFDPTTLMKLCAENDLFKELGSLTYTNKDGEVMKSVEPSFSIHYESVMSWLKSTNRQDILSKSYHEVESTPAVKGPKTLAFLGEQKDG